MNGPQLWIAVEFAFRQLRRAADGLADNQETAAWLREIADGLEEALAEDRKHRRNELRRVRRLVRKIQPHQP